MRDTKTQIGADDGYKQLVRAKQKGAVMESRTEELTQVETLRVTIYQLLQNEASLKMQILLRDIRERLGLDLDEKLTLRGDQVIIEKKGTDEASL